MKEQRRRHKPRLRQGEAPCSGLQPNQIHPCGAPYLYVQYAHMLPSASTCWSVQKNPSNSLLAAISKLTHVTSICKTPSNFAIRENQGRAATYIRSSPWVSKTKFSTYSTDLCLPVFPLKLLPFPSENCCCCFSCWASWTWASITDLQVGTEMSPKCTWDYCCLRSFIPVGWNSQLWVWGNPW